MQYRATIWFPSVFFEFAEKLEDMHCRVNSALYCSQFMKSQFMMLLNVLLLSAMLLDCSLPRVSYSLHTFVSLYVCMQILKCWFTQRSLALT